MIDEKDRTESVTVATRITKAMYDAVQRIVQLNAHVSVSDYVRDVIRRDLERKGLLDMEDTKNGS
jgi:Arc/MetJ-type ribon-helix-helix transcriptional regulator